MRRIYFFIILAIPFSLCSQSNLKIGDWQSYLPYKDGRKVTQSNEKIYYATDESILILDKDDNSIEVLSKVNGLSDTGVQNILYDQVNEQLIIAYSSSIIDVVKGSEVIRVTDIVDKTSILGDKQIYDMYIQNGEFLYLATGFGLVQYNLVTLEFGFTLDISSQVSAVSGDGSTLVMVTDESAYVLDLTMTNAPAFFDEWKRQTDGLDETEVVVDVWKNEDKTYIVTEKKIYQAINNDDSYEVIYENPFEALSIIFLNPTPKGWMIGFKNPIDTLGSSKLVLFDKDDNQMDLVENSCLGRITDAILTEEGQLYLGDEWKRIHFLNADGSCSEVSYNSPFNAEVTDISLSSDAVYFAPGGVTENLGDQFTGSGFYQLKNGEWTNFNSTSSDFIKNNELFHVHKVAVSPFDSKVYFASFWSGILQFDSDTEAMTLWNKENSTLQGQIGDANGRVRISGLAFDSQNNLWVSNYSAEEPISVRWADGTWQSFPLIGASDDKVEDITVDNNDYVWVTIFGTSGGVYVLDPATGNRRFISQGNASEINSNFVNAVAVDRSGAVWVGTGQGAVVFECGTAVLDASVCPGNRPIVNVNGIDAYLLESEDVLCIAVDGADRKWFGTRNGIFVQSPNGSTMIAQYDIDNSPLFDNIIREMAFDEESGVMYIATSKGIQSLKTETTGSNVRHNDEVYAYPNPVRPEYEGPIAIRGLAQDAEVRITDMDGKLVFKTDALGGQAIWDGFNLEGNEVAGGVYLVFSSSSSDPFGRGEVDAYVTKILVVK